MIQWLKKHWEVLSYLIFGVLTTLLNILLYALFNRLFGYTAANSWGNVLDNILCILFAYATNRAFVFRSKTRGREQAKEFTAFVSCRLGTLLLDAAIMLVLGNLLAAQGAALMDSLMSGLLTRAFRTGLARTRRCRWLRAPIWRTPSVASRMVRRPLPSSAGPMGPRPFLSPAAWRCRRCGACAVKVFSNVIVVILNYVFSKRIVFKKK